MLQVKRHELILNKLANEKTVRTAELSKLYNISRQTIHKDIDYLASQGKLIKVHGGAILKQKSTEPSIQNRNRLNIHLKEKIAKRAAEYVSNGDTIYLDIGTTIKQMIPYLRHLSDLTIITNSVYIAYLLGGYDNIQIILSGGHMRNQEHSLSGPITIKNLKRYYVDKSFIGIGGFSEKAGYTDYHIDEANVRQLMISHSKTSFALLDYSKFNVLAVTQFAEKRDINIAIADDNAPENLLNSMREAGTHIDIVQVSSEYSHSDYIPKD